MQAAMGDRGRGARFKVHIHVCEMPAKINRGEKRKCSRNQKRMRAKNGLWAGTVKIQIESRILGR